MKKLRQEPYGCGDQVNGPPCMFQMYNPKRMLVRWAVFDAIRLTRCKTMARRPSNRLRAQLIVGISALSRQTRFKSMVFGRL
jgi:hypothetical protein